MLCAKSREGPHPEDKCRPPAPGRTEATRLRIAEMLRPSFQPKKTSALARIDPLALVKSDPGEQHLLAQSKNKITYHPRRRRARWLRMIHAGGMAASSSFCPKSDRFWPESTLSHSLARAKSDEVSRNLDGHRHHNAGTRQWVTFGEQTQVNSRECRSRACR